MARIMGQGANEVGPFFRLYIVFPNFLLKGDIVSVQVSEAFNTNICYQDHIRGYIFS